MIVHISIYLGKCYNQTFPYIDYDGKELTIAADGQARGGDCNSNRISAS